MLDIGTGPDGGGITFGHLAGGIVVAQRHPGMWPVSVRPNPDGTGMRYYTDPTVVAPVVIAREHHETAAVKPPRPARAFVLAVRIPGPRIVVRSVDQDLDGEAANRRRPGARLKPDRRAMAGGRIEGAGLRGIMRLTWVEDHLAHVLEHGGTDEPAGAWTGLACQDHGLALGGDVDNATLRRLSAHGAIADLIWEPRPELAAEHGRLLQAAIQAAQDGKPDRGEQLRQQVQAIWSLAWSANYAALTFVQDAGLSRFSPARPQRWVAASFEHHRGPHGRPHPHVHNIVITTLTTGAC